MNYSNCMCTTYGLEKIHAHALESDEMKYYECGGLREFWERLSNRFVETRSCHACAAALELGMKRRLSSPSCRCCPPLCLAAMPPFRLFVSGNDGRLHPPAVHASSAPPSACNF